MRPERACAAFHRVAVLGVSLLLAASAAQAQELGIPGVAYPTLPAAGPNAAAFTPAGWRVKSEASGDLNADRIADLAFVLRMEAPANVLTHEGLGNNPLDTNPRLFAVALGRPGGGYRLVVQNRDLIPRHTEPTQEDPYNAIAIERGAVQIGLSRMMNAGGWDAGTTTFTFRWREDALRLIGFDYFNVHRGSGQFSSLSVNYLTRRVSVTTGNVSSDDESVRWLRLPARASPPTIEEIGDGLEFDPDGMIERLP